MNNLQKYRQLTKAIRDARANLDTYEKKVTSYHDVYDLNGENPSETCINVYDRVKLPDGQINDESVHIEYCDDFSWNDTFCRNAEKCGFSECFDKFCYCSAKNELDSAIAARRKFVRKLFKVRARWKLLKRYSRHVSEARQRLIEAEQAITYKVTEDDFDMQHAMVNKRCINKFSDVVVDIPDTEYVDDTGVIAKCKWLKSGVVCTNPEFCEYKAAQVAQRAAQKAFDEAVAAKYDWIFGRQSKQQ